MLQCTRALSSSARLRFQLPSTYKPNSRVVKKLEFSKALEIWWKSLGSSRLQTLQNELVDHLFSDLLEENKDVIKTSERIPIDDKGNCINQISFKVDNKSDTTKHVVFLHGYGASLGCFARNFHLVNRLKGLKDNYTVHFLDNLSFGLSSNPKMEQVSSYAPIPRISHIKMHDTKPTDPKNLYNKYYKLIDGYDFDVKEFEKEKTKMIPLLKDIESYYVDAVDAWRKSMGISKIDFLVGHSYGGYWSGSYSVKYPDNLKNLVLLSPVGVERHAFAVTAPIPNPNKDIQPSLDPTSYNFLSRLPILAQKTVSFWYNVQPYLPRLLRYMGPWGVSKYYDMWYSKLFAINKVIKKLGGEKVFTSYNELVYGTNTECRLLIEYLYNSITSGTHSDILIKYVLTPATTSRWPLFDKFTSAKPEDLSRFRMHVVYGQYDFMNSEAGDKLVKELNETHKCNAQFHTVAEGGHNLYIQNPFGTNELLEQIIKDEQ